MKLKALLLILVTSLSLQAKVLIWDLGGVLFKPNKFGMGRSVGLSHFIGRMLFDWKSPKIEPILFDVLDMMDCPEVPDKVYACTDKGVPLPAIMCHWQAGVYTGKEIIEMALPHIENLYESGYFISRREKSLIKKTICTMFNPSILAKHMTPMNRGLNLLYECSHETNQDGSHRNRNIALSNWDAQSFDILHKEYDDVFDHFDEISISGKTGFIKPRKKAYKHLIDTYKLDPQECLLIDDQEINLDAAEELGFNTFHVHKNNFQELRSVLREFGALEQRARI